MTNRSKRNHAKTKIHIFIFPAQCWSKWSIPAYKLEKDIVKSYLISKFDFLSLIGSWIYLKNMENLSQSLSIVLAQSLSSIHQALVRKQKSVTIGNDEVTLKPYAAIFAYSSTLGCITSSPRSTLNDEDFKPIPINTKRFFKTVSYNPPDPHKILEIALVKAGMFLTRDLVPKIVSFLSTIQEIVPAFCCSASGSKVCFGRSLCLVLAKCMHQNFKEILR